jgi:pilus assembly protein CpaB
MKMNTARRLPPARLVVVVISLAAGIGAAVLASGSNPPVIIAKDPVSSIVVAAGPLEYGTTLTDANVNEVPWESSNVPEGAFKSKADLLKDGERAVLTSMRRNEPVLRSRITGPNQPTSLANRLWRPRHGTPYDFDRARSFILKFIMMYDNKPHLIFECVDLNVTK